MRFALYPVHGSRFVHPEHLPFQAQTRLSSFSAISRLDDFETPKLDSTYPFSTQLQTFLQDKLLLLSELPSSIELIHHHYLHGYVSYMKAIRTKEKRYTCVRCGNQEQRLFASYSCSRCFDECVYCRNCVMMSRVSECMPLLYWRGPKRSLSSQRCTLNWREPLSDEQEKAANYLERAIGEKREILIWAVCGAGKTSILYKGLEKAFAQGKRVCLATPRVDVVKELLPHFRQAFPTITIRALYGGSPDQDEDAELVISTTHQLLRSCDRFDVMVIDEVDAFPYSFDTMLEFAVERAKKSSATSIYLTATPSDQFKHNVHHGKLECVKIPIRHHGQLLPVPQLKWCGNWRRSLRKQQLQKQLGTWVGKQLASGRQAFLFVPSVKVLKTVEHLLLKKFKGIETVHAGDDEREDKIMNFRNGQTSILVTTTIMERGVTVPNIDVAVLGAEDVIFTENALVQIAGRVGRSADFPTGEITFFHYGKTVAIVKAIQHIEEMNREAISLKKERME